MGKRGVDALNKKAPHLLLALLGGELGGLDALELALMVHLSSLQLQLERPQLRGLLTHARGRPRLPLLIGCGRCERCGELLVVVAALGLVGGVLLGELLPLLGLLLLRCPAQLVLEPPPLDALVGTEVLAERLVGGEVSRERAEVVFACTLRMQPLLVRA